MKTKIIQILIFSVILVWSGIQPKDSFTWFLEVFPSIIGLVIVLVTFKNFPLTPLLYWLILIHSVILMVGGHYTYAEVPLFDTIADFFGSGRNNYDKVGHLAQGFIPAMIAREILIRKNIVQTGGWLNVIVVSMAMAISLCYELLEWFVAEITGENAEAFLGTQGYVWDTQSDMLFASLGAIFALIALSKIHNKQIQQL